MLNALWPGECLVHETGHRTHRPDGTLVTHPGVSCLRTNELTWESEQLWRTDVMLTDLEAVFRSLKSELGLIGRA